LQQGNFEALTQTIDKWLFFVEPPDHTRLRSLVSKAFTAAKIEQMRPQIQAMVDRLLDKVQDKGWMDVMADLAAPLPALVSAEMLGIPRSEHSGLVQWAYDLFHVFDQPLSLQDYQHINHVAVEFKSYFCRLIAVIRKQPQDNLISKLIEARDDQGRLNEAELLAFLSMLFSVGQETTENLIGNGMLALLDHPGQMEQLRQNPAIVGSAVEELLRYDSPVQMISRTAIAEVELEGKTIRRGDKVNLLLGAANHDPAKFEEPDRLDITRKESHRLPFGAGIHYCLGAELARVQGQIAINAMVQRFQNLKLNPNGLERRKNIVLRGLKVLPVTYRLLPIS
jgi:pimeloyl-[acyl-carrier protein] synthase